MGAPAMSEPGRAASLQAPAAFVVTSRRAGGRETLSLSGELDLATAVEAEAALRRLEAGDAPAIVLDLSGLTFIDVTGVRLVALGDARSRTSGNRLTVVRPAPRVFRVFEICDLADRLPFTA